MPERYAWTATYADGTTVDERHPSGDPSLDRGFGEVDHARLASVALVPDDPAAPPVIVCVPQDVGARGIFFRRRARGLFGDPQGSGLNLTCVGWQRTVNGANVKTLLFLTDDGRILLTDRDVQDMGA